MLKRRQLREIKKFVLIYLFDMLAKKPKRFARIEDRREKLLTTSMKLRS